MKETSLKTREIFDKEIQYPPNPFLKFEWGNTRLNIN